MKRKLALSLLICMLPSQGCQWLAKLDADRNVEQARIDDTICRQRGYEWPGEAYTECRRQQADALQHEQWQALQMSRQQQSPQVAIRPEGPVEPYRPIREDRFRCEEAVANDGARYIDCIEQ